MSVTQLELRRSVKATGALIPNLNLVVKMIGLQIKLSAEPCTQRSAV